MKDLGQRMWGVEFKDMGILETLRFTVGQCLLTVPGVGGSGTGLRFTVGREAAPGREGWTQMEVVPLMHTPDPTNIVADFASCGFVCVHGDACVLFPD